MNIAANLKRLRKARDITQEELAAYIGVSPQSISKWERGEGLPDITLISTIASFFRVTLDELFGMDELHNEERRAEFERQIMQFFNQGKLQDVLATAREALKAFPNDFGFMDTCATVLMSLAWEEPGETDAHNAFAEESYELCERILRDCTDEKYRPGAMQKMIYMAKELRKLDYAKELVNKLPGIYTSREAQLPAVTTIEEDGTGLEVIQEIVQGVTEFLANRVHVLAMSYRFRLMSEDAVKSLGKIVKLFELFYEDGDFGFYNCRIGDAYLLMAEIAVTNHPEDALGYLEQAATHIIAYDALPEAFPHTSVMFSRIFYDLLGTSKSTEHNGSWLALEKLKRVFFDAIRDEPRFAAVVKRLEAVSA